MDEQAPQDHEYRFADDQSAKGYLAEDGEAAAAEAAAASRARRRIRWLIILVPLFLCLATSLLAAVVAAPLREQMAANLAPRLPVTGADPHFALTPEAQPKATREPPGPAPEPLLGLSYHQTAADMLSTCMGSFHNFFILEELATHQPDILKSDTWQDDVAQTMTSFREDCEKLGTLPDAPPGYTELDRWLKLAAAEVGPAADGLNDAMQSQKSSDLRSSIRHMMRFVEFTHNAEAILDGFEQRREI